MKTWYEKYADDRGILRTRAVTDRIPRVGGDHAQFDVVKKMDLIDLEQSNKDRGLTIQKLQRALRRANRRSASRSRSLRRKETKHDRPTH